MGPPPKCPVPPTAQPAATIWRITCLAYPIPVPSLTATPTSISVHGGGTYTLTTVGTSHPNSVFRWDFGGIIRSPSLRSRDVWLISRSLPVSLRPRRFAPPQNYRPLLPVRATR